MKRLFAACQVAAVLCYLTFLLALLTFGILDIGKAVTDPSQEHALELGAWFFAAVPTFFALGWIFDHSFTALVKAERSFQTKTTTPPHHAN